LSVIVKEEWVPSGSTKNCKTPQVESNWGGGEKERERERKREKVSQRFSLF
jgi:hypothetical protein